MTPTETRGPYPSLVDLVRSDIREGGSGTNQGRATHIHVEVKRNGQPAKVTQIAFPESVNATVYTSGVYASRGANPTSNTRDGIFADSLASELATVTGDSASGYTATFTVGIPG